MVEGEIIGQNNNTGNLTGAHLHLEFWDKNKKTYDPEIAFRHHNIKVGAPLESMKAYRTVRSGDTLSEIAEEYKTTPAKIMKLNPDVKNANVISVGLKLRVK